MKKEPDFLKQKQIVQGDKLIRVCGLGGQPCIAINPSKRKTLVRFPDQTDKWIENKFLRVIDDDRLAASISRSIRDGNPE